MKVKDPVELIEVRERGKEIERKTFLIITSGTFKIKVGSFAYPVLKSSQYPTHRYDSSSDVINV